MPLSKISAFLIGFCISLFSFSQKESSRWHFGHFAGLDFSSGTAITVSSPSMSAPEGCASMADGAGNLLFYTNGTAIWDKNHSVMANGSGLLGDFSSTQCLILQRPGSSHEYYVFTLDDAGGPDGLRYSTVDMSLAAGLGSVTVLNTLLFTPCAEKLSAVKHCNGTDIWVLAHDYNGTNFKAFLITAAGVSLTPVVSSIGTSYNSNVGWSSAMKFSPNGKKLGLCIQSTNGINMVSAFELYDFDNVTGTVSNFQVLGSYVKAGYGSEFSPDGTKFYGSFSLDSEIYQWDLCANNALTIIKSQFSGYSNYFASLQLGPDHKIYVCRSANATLGVINNPNVAGPGCNYSDSGPVIQPQGLMAPTSVMGLPGFIASHFQERSPQPAFSPLISCYTTTFTPAPPFCSGVVPTPVGYSWDFGDPASGTANTSLLNAPVHTYPGPGTYTVKQVIHYPCHTDTLRVPLVISAQGSVLSVNGTFSICPGQSTTLTASGAASYSWSTNSSSASIVVSPLTSTSYSVTGTDPVSACKTSSAVTVNVLPLPILGVTGFTAVCPGQGSTLTAQGAASYTWNGTVSSATLTVPPGPASNHTLVGVSQHGCRSMRVFNVAVISCTGLPDLSSAENIRVYPNPSSSDLFVDTEAPAAFRLINALGQVMLEGSFERGTHIIDLRRFSNGAYILQCTSGGSVTNLRVVKAE